MRGAGFSSLPPSPRSPHPPCFLFPCAGAQEAESHALRQCPKILFENYSCCPQLYTLPHHMLNPFKPPQQILTDISRTNLSLSKSRGKTKATRFVGCAVRKSLFSEFREFSPFQKCLRNTFCPRENGVRREIEANATTHDAHED